MDDYLAKQLIELIQSQSNVQIGQGVISGNTLTINGISGEIVGKCQGDNVLLRGEDGQWYGFVNSSEQKREIVSSRSIRNYKRQPIVDSIPEIVIFLLDVSNSIEMRAIYKVKYILEGNIETPIKIKGNDLVGIFSFSDGVCKYSKYINKLLKKSKVIEILNNIINGYNNLEDKYDRYNPDSFTYADFNISLDDSLKDEKLQAYSKFWLSNGTDLPENGMDAIVEAVNKIPRKYNHKEVYLITDSDEYSRNINTINTVESVLNLKLKKIYFDIINPKNILTENNVNKNTTYNYCPSSVVCQLNINQTKYNFPPNPLISYYLKSYGYKLFEFELNVDIVKYVYNDPDLQFIAFCVEPSGQNRTYIEQWQWPPDGGRYNMRLMTHGALTIDLGLSLNRNIPELLQYFTNKISPSQGVIALNGLRIVQNERFKSLISSAGLTWQGKRTPWKTTFDEVTVLGSYTLVTPVLFHAYPYDGSYYAITNNSYKYTSSGYDVVSSQFSPNLFNGYDSGYNNGLDVFLHQRLDYNVLESINNVVIENGSCKAIDENNQVVYQWANITNIENLGYIVHYVNDQPKEYELKVIGNNYDHTFGLTGNEVVKVVCQPQAIPNELPNKGNYSVDLPASDKIIYL